MNSEEGIGKKFRGLGHGIPPPRQAEAPPFGKGGFGLSIYFHPVTIPGFGGAVTICWRLPWEIATGGTPACEIVSGDSPQAPLLKGAGAEGD